MIQEPINYNKDRNTDLFFYVGPDLEPTDTQDVVYRWVKGDYAYARYWSNNWRKMHGLPLRRAQKGKRFPTLYVLPEYLSEEQTTRMRESQKELERILGRRLEDVD